MDKDALQFHPTVIGIINGKPVYRIAGGAVDDDLGDMSGGMPSDDVRVPPDDDDRQVEDDDDDDDEGGRREDEDDRVPKADLERARAALKNERRLRKRAEREFEERVNALKSETTEASTIEVEKAKIQVKNERDAYWAEEIIRAKAAAEFTAQGATAEMADRLAGLVKLKNVEYDERDREWDGLEDEIDAIMTANPDFFKTKAAEEEDDRGGRKRGGGTRPRVDAGSRGKEGGGAPRRRPSTAQLLADQALGGPRRRTSRR